MNKHFQRYVEFIKIVNAKHYSFNFTKCYLVFLIDPGNNTVKRHSRMINDQTTLCKFSQHSVPLLSLVVFCPIQHSLL